MQYLLTEVKSIIQLKAMGTDVVFIDRSKEYHSTEGYGPFHTYFSARVMLIIEEATVTVKCRTAV